MTFHEAVQYIRNTITAYFNPNVHEENLNQSLNTAMTSIARIASDTARAVNDFRETGLAFATNPTVAHAAHTVSNALGMMEVDAQNVYNAAINNPFVIASFMQALPQFIAIRDAHNAGTPPAQLFPLLRNAAMPTLNTVLAVADNTPSGVRLRAAVEAAIESASNDEHIQNRLMTAFEAMSDMITHAYATQEMNPADVARSSVAFRAAVQGLATLVETAAQSAITVHATPPAPILNAAPGARTRRHRRDDSDDNHGASNDKKINDTIGHRAKRRKK